MSNTLTNVMPKILAQGVMALRQNAVFAQLVNRDLQSVASQRGNVVNVPIPSAVAARAVTAAVTHAANVDSNPTVALVTLDQWYEAPIQLSDNDTVSADPMFITMQSSEAIKSLANNVDSYIWGKHVGFFNFAGVSGTAPFNGSLTAAGSIRRQLSESLAPLTDRRFVIDPSAEANLLLNQEVLQFQMRGDTEGIINGTIGRKLGFDFYVNQNVTTHTAGTGWTSGFIASTVSGVVGQSTLNILNATASGSVVVGDVFSILGNNGKYQQYVVTAAATVSATVGSVISIYPPIVSTITIGATLGGVNASSFAAGTYVRNVAFHRDAWAFASRPLMGAFQAGNIFQSPTDPISGIALRLELSRQYKQETLSYDILYGAGVVRRELGAILMG